jgi:hypothetical protein
MYRCYCSLVVERHRPAKGKYQLRHNLNGRNIYRVQSGGTLLLDRHRQLPFPLTINHQSYITMADQAAKLEQYIALAKSARGESAAKLIVNATSAVSYFLPCEDLDTDTDD